MTLETSYEIYPSVAIHRFGPSDEWFLGPEPDCADVSYFDTTTPVPRCNRTTPPSSFRDSTANHLLKRQAARFRVFECTRDANGKVLQEARELKATEARITWRVHLANRKAAARKFADSGLRNRSGTGTTREAKLVVDGGA